MIRIPPRQSKHTDTHTILLDIVWLIMKSLTTVFIISLISSLMMTTSNYYMARKVGKEMKKMTKELSNEMRDMLRVSKRLRRAQAHTRSKMERRNTFLN